MVKCKSPSKTTLPYIYLQKILWTIRCQATKIRVTEIWRSRSYYWLPKVGTTEGCGRTVKRMKRAQLWSTLQELCTLLKLFLLLSLFFRHLIFSNHTHIFQGYFTGTKTPVPVMPPCKLWVNTLHHPLWTVIIANKKKTEHIFHGIYCSTPRGPFSKQGLTLIPAWISNYIHYKAWEWISNCTPHLTGLVIIYPCWD